MINSVLNSADTAQYAKQLNSVRGMASEETSEAAQKAPEPITADRSTKRSEPLRTPDGDVLDLDWNRVRRFVQRFKWRTEPPRILQNVENYRKSSEPASPFFSRDGDRVDLNFGKPDFNKNVIYGKEDISKTDPIEPKGSCGTCESRRYVDRSDDSSVSYQTPTKLNPQTAATAVAAHEREHVFNERARADREGREIVSQTVTIKYAICPECNTMYPSGGTTRTQSTKTDCADQGGPADENEAAEA